MIENTDTALRAILCLLPEFGHVEMGHEHGANLSDVAARPSSVTCDVHPSRLLEMNAVWLIKDNKEKFIADPICMTIAIGDMDAFEKLLDFYEKLSSVHREYVIEWTIRGNRPDMVDMAIRRFGSERTVRLEGPTFHEEPMEDAPGAGAKKQRVYNGLAAGGKKRRDPVDMVVNQSKPILAPPVSMLSTAVSSDAVNVIDYLASSRVLEAFRYYAEHGNDAQAKILKSTEDLKGSLMQWLGWEANEIRESPLTVGIRVDRILAVKKLWEHEPKLMLEAMNLK